MGKVNLLKEGEKLIDFGWGIARKKPVEVHYREVIPDTWENGVDVPAEIIYTREGTIVGHPDEDFIILGVDGERYPIKKSIFEKTYDVIMEPSIASDNLRKEEEC